MMMMTMTTTVMVTVMVIMAVAVAVIIIKHGNFYWNQFNPLAAEFFFLTSGDNFLHTFIWHGIYFFIVTAGHGLIFWYSHFATGDFS